MSDGGLPGYLIKSILSVPSIADISIMYRELAVACSNGDVQPNVHPDKLNNGMIAFSEYMILLVIV